MICYLLSRLKNKLISPKLLTVGDLLLNKSNELIRNKIILTLYYYYFMSVRQSRKSIMHYVQSW